MYNITNKIKDLFKLKNTKLNLKYIKNEPDYSHLQDRKKYKAMYNEVGNVEANKMIKWREEWMHYFKPSPNSLILELGSHNGPNLIHYARQGHTIDGVEISDTLIKTFNKYKKKESKEVQGRIGLHRGWIEEFKPQRQYDYVLCTEILEHVVNPILILKKATEALKPEGMVYISSPAILIGNNTHVRGVPGDELKEWLKEAGLVATWMTEEHGQTFCYAKRID